MMTMRCLHLLGQAYASPTYKYVITGFCSKYWTTCGGAMKRSLSRAKPSIKVDLGLTRQNRAACKDSVERKKLMNKHKKNLIRKLDAAHHSERHRLATL